MSRSLALASAFLVAAAPAFARMSAPLAPVAPPAPVAEPAPPAPPDAPAPPAAMRVMVSPGDDDHFMFVARSSDGDAHQLKVQSRDGRVVIEGEPDARRPWLGILLDGSDDGVEVTGVMEGSPAADAGLQVGDVIKKVNGHEVNEDTKLLEGLQPGAKVDLVVERDGDTKTLRAKLGSYPGRMEFKSEHGMAPFAIAGDLLGGLHSLEALKSLKNLPGLQFHGDDGKAFAFAWGGRPRLGVEVERLSAQLAEYFGTDEGKGLLVKAVTDDMPAVKAGVKAGDVLLRVGDTDIADAADIREALADVKKGESVEVEVLRRGERRTLNVTMDSDPVSEDADEQGSLMNMKDHVFVMPGCGDLDGILGPEEAAKVRAELERARAEVATIDVEKIQREVEEASKQAAKAGADAAEQAQRHAEQLLEEMKAQRGQVREIRVAPTVGRAL